MRKQTIGVAAVVSLALVVVVLAGDQNHPAASADLAAAGPPRPGPGVLYSPAPVAPQLQSRGPWFRAAPILI
ncbi:MAG: hypothetical protein ACRDY7_12760, partial [Acidimicrobiia bacterium]